MAKWAKALKIFSVLARRRSRFRFHWQKAHFMIRNFRHACLVVSDLERALRFYRDVIGLKMVKRLTIEGECPETVLDKKGIKLTYVKMRAPNQNEGDPPIFELHCWENPKIPTESSYNHISFTVENLDQEYERLKSLGVEFISKPVDVTYSNAKLCFCYDPDNHLIELIEDK